MPTETAADTTLTASELRVVLGQLVRLLRAEHRFPLIQGAVLGRLDREGPQSVSDLAVAEKVRPQSMAQTVAELESNGLVARRPDPADGGGRWSRSLRRGAPRSTRTAATASAGS